MFARKRERERKRRTENNKKEEVRRGCNHDGETEVILIILGQILREGMEDMTENYSKISPGSRRFALSGYRPNLFGFVSKSFTGRGD